MPNDFALDIAAIRKRARAHLDAGPVTPTNTADLERLLAVLNEVLATEIVCWMRYQRHAISVAGINRVQVAAEFTEHAADEMAHALSIAERISQLNGEPDFSPKGLSDRSHSEYKVYDDGDWVGMLKENLVAERVVIQSYQEIIRWLAESDPTTRRLMEGILADEEDHADDLNDLLGDLA